MERESLDVDLEGSGPRGDGSASMAAASTCDGSHGRGGGDSDDEAASSWHALLPPPARSQPHRASPSGSGDVDMESEAPGSCCEDAGGPALLPLPPELLVAIASTLSHAQLKGFRLACSSLRRAADTRMRAVRLGLRTVDAGGRYGRPTWLDQLQQLCLQEPAPHDSSPEMHGVTPTPTPQPQLVAGAPVCQWLRTFGPQLVNLSTVTMQHVPYVLEALVAVRDACPSVRSLAVQKLPSHVFNMEAFWDAVAGFPRLESLVVEGWTLQLADLHGLETLDQLRELHIKRSTNFPTGLRCLSCLTNLRSITLEEIDYPGTIPQEFCGLSRLTTLESVRFVTVGPLADEIVALAHVTRLKTLEISQHYDESLIPALYHLMSSITSLESVSIPQFELTDGLARHLAMQPRLNTLVVGRWRLTTAVLQSADLSEVREILQSNAAAWSSAAAPLLPHVRYLSLRCYEAVLPSDLSGAVLPICVVLPSLETLSLQMLALAGQRAMYTDSVLEHTGALFRHDDVPLPLTSLAAFADVMAARSIPSGCPNLRELSLDCCNVFTAPSNGADVQSEDAFEQAPIVAVAANGQDAPVPAVSHGVAAAAEGDVVVSTVPPWLQHLHLLHNLQVVELKGCYHISDSDCLALAASLPGGVADLRLDVCPRVSDAGLQALGASLSRLRKLAISHACSVTAMGIVQLLHASPSLQQIDLCMCSPVTPEQCQYIMKCFIAAGRCDLNIECRDFFADMM